MSLFSLCMHRTLREPHPHSCTAYKTPPFFIQPVPTTYPAIPTYTIRLMRAAAFLTPSHLFVRIYSIGHFLTPPRPPHLPPHPGMVGSLSELPAPLRLFLSGRHSLSSPLLSCPLLLSSTCTSRRRTRLPSRLTAPGGLLHAGNRLERFCEVVVLPCTGPLVICSSSAALPDR
jgi:hypothetical protein